MARKAMRDQLPGPVKMDCSNGLLFHAPARTAIVPTIAMRRSGSATGLAISSFDFGLPIVRLGMW